MTYDNEYAYIQTFIDFLRQILEMIKEFFGGMGSKKDSEETTAPAETAAPTV